VGEGEVVEPETPADQEGRDGSILKARRTTNDRFVYATATRRAPRRLTERGKPGCSIRSPSRHGRVHDPH
jgi:hypothetical protein